jgi:hypothetical protein
VSGIPFACGDPLSRQTRLALTLERDGRATGFGQSRDE